VEPGLLKRLIPIHELLNRNRWDSEFAKGKFQLGYYDRAEDRIILVPLKEVTFPDDSTRTFQLADSEDQLHRIPFLATASRFSNQDNSKALDRAFREWHSRRNTATSEN
jgi:hypothetical protein